MENHRVRAAILFIAIPATVLLGYLLRISLYELAVSSLPEPRDYNEAIGVGESREVAGVMSCVCSALFVFCVVVPLFVWVMWWELTDGGNSSAEENDVDFNGARNDKPN